MRLHRLRGDDGVLPDTVEVIIGDCHAGRTIENKPAIGAGEGDIGQRDQLAVDQSRIARWTRRESAAAGDDLAPTNDDVARVLLNDQPADGCAGRVDRDGLRIGFADDERPALTGQDEGFSAACRCELKSDGGTGGKDHT